MIQIKSKREIELMRCAGRIAANALAASLWSIRRTHRIDFLAVNAENAGFIIGPSP